MYNKIKLYFRFRKLEAKLKKAGKITDLSKSNDGFRKHVLIIDDKIPEYDKDSGSRRLTEIIKLLLKNGYGVYLLPNVKEYKYKADYAEYFRQLGVVVYEPAVTPQGKLITREGFIEQVAQKSDFAWLHRPNIFEKYYPVVKRFSPEIPVIFDMVDFHYLRMMREADLKNDPALVKDAEKNLKVELENCRKADKVIVISDKDKEALASHYPDTSKMEIIGNIHNHLPKTSEFKSFNDRRGLLFIGGFAHKPNEDAVLWLHNEIMPLVWKKNPDIRVAIVGSNPTDAVVAQQSERFSIVGYVEDVAPYFNDARIFVAPLRYGAGIKGKIGQSLEFSLPLVTTPVGAEGFDFGSYSNIIISDTADDLAEKIIGLYNNEQLWNEVSDASADVIEPFSLQTVERSILKALS